MKQKHALFLAIIFGFAAALHAADKAVAGPKGGRLLETAPLKTEFLVNPERKVEIRFYNAALEPVAPGSRVVAVIAEAGSGRVPLEFEKTASGLISKAPLPEGDPYRVVVQVREKAGAKPQNFRVELNLEECAECAYAEYACICGH